MGQYLIMAHFFLKIILSQQGLRKISNHQATGSDLITRNKNCQMTLVTKAEKDFKNIYFKVHEQVNLFQIPRIKLFL